MSDNSLEQRKQQFMVWERALNAQQRLVFRIAAVVDILMILWLPKYVEISNPILGTHAGDTGYNFIFSSPISGEQGFAADMVGASVHINLVRLIIQFVLVNGAAFAAIKYLKDKG